MAGDERSGAGGSGDDSALSRAERVRRQAEDRQKRLAGALRANLHRRKSQSRGRDGTGDGAGEGDGAGAGEGDSGGAAGADPAGRAPGDGPARSGTD
ncbi:MAG: hypothetical protein F8N37_01525 [Telmatospirillum sp.]|nr:hypothetical protein [Telmatospirillum sp.]